MEKNYMMILYDYSIVISWPRHMISLVIIFHNILLSPLIALIYRFVLDGSPFRYIKPHLSIIKN